MAHASGPTNLTTDEIADVKQLYQKGDTFTSIARHVNRHVKTVTRMIKRNKWERLPNRNTQSSLDVQTNILELPHSEQQKQHNNFMLSGYSDSFTDLTQTYRTTSSVQELKTKVEVLEKLNKLGRSILSMDSAEGARVVNINLVGTDPGTVAAATQAAIDISTITGTQGKTLELLQPASQHKE